MAVFKCKMCGGTIEFKESETVGICDSCGTQQTLPRLDNDKKTNLYDRANHFRRSNDFDKAMGIYEQILNEDRTDAEAYWSLVLCRYGIEYVEDPTTHKRIPTVNRAQFTSIFADEDYKSAKEYADEIQKAIYESEAEAIDRIQKGILEISSKEKPFDVFICYKETDVLGKRTHDSVLANDLYHQLTKEGFKVFFSKITLEEKLGTEYEPYIFAALNSAKVMVVLGTKPEYFNAPWVKNEWSRFLMLVKKSKGEKLLIPAYKDMDPYDLPEEFSHLQAQDMSKLGFMQDLIRGIKKIIYSDTSKPEIKETVSANLGNSESLLKRAFIFLEDSSFKEADEYCEKVLDIDPECSQAYLGKLMAELHVKKREELANLPENFGDNNNYKKIIRFGDKKLSDEVKEYISIIDNRNATEIYTNAKEIMASATSEDNYEKAAELFEQITQFKDANSLAVECREMAKEKIYRLAERDMQTNNIRGYESAINAYKKIPGWRDSDEKLRLCKIKIAELNEKARKEKIEKEREEKRTKKLGLIVLIAFVIFFIFMLVYVNVIIPQQKYSSAVKAANNGNVIEAYEYFIELGNYKDCTARADILSQDNPILAIGNPDIGDIISFGSYGQDGINTL